MTIVWKALEEVGLSIFIRTPFLLSKVCFGGDIDTPRLELSQIQNGYLDLPYGQKQDDGDVDSIVNRLESDSKWRNIARTLAELSFYEWSEEDIDLRNRLQGLSNVDHSYLSYYNKTLKKSDYWEWYLTPWHRTYGQFAIAYLDPRLRSRLDPVWDQYDKMFREETPWMTKVKTGANVAGVSAGYALHSLLGLLLEKGDDEFYLKQYNKYLDQFHSQLNRAFDVADNIAFPMEGITYGNFIWSTAVYLGILQKKLDIWSILETDQAQHYSKYVTMSQTPESEFQASGDSRTNMNYMPTRSFFSAMVYLYNDVDAEKITDEFTHEPIVSLMFE